MDDLRISVGRTLARGEHPLYQCPPPWTIFAFQLDGPWPGANILYISVLRHGRSSHFSWTDPGQGRTSSVSVSSAMDDLRISVGRTLARGEHPLYQCPPPWTIFAFQ